MVIGKQFQISSSFWSGNLPGGNHNNDQWGKRVFASPNAGTKLRFNRLEQLDKSVSNTYKSYMTDNSFFSTGLTLGQMRIPVDVGSPAILLKTFEH